VCGVTTSEPSEVLLAAGAHFAIRDFTEATGPFLRLASG
jgi:hypothetical protein